ncbi:PAS domain S-box protein [Thiohalorhabdus methylotrophus]|uniref:histidine kinase n=1 Tax=Thiohalorhabdus methylotrophus TaxID=3242694 RepID=A0ABV4TYH9_9GAMM
MKERPPSFFLAALFVSLPIAASLLGIFFLYLTALDQAQEDLRNNLQNQVQLIQRLSEGSAEGHPSSAFPLQQGDRAGSLAAMEALRRNGNLGKGREIILGRDEGGQMLITFRQRAAEPEKPVFTSPAQGWAKPMARALAGESGVVRGRDYRGKRVITAYQPLPGDSGAVMATQNLESIQDPFERALWITGLCGWLLGILGASIYNHTVTPLWEELQSRERSLRVLLGNLPGMVFRSRNDPDWSMEFVSPGFSEITGYDPAELERLFGSNYSLLIHPEDQGLVWTRVQEAVANDHPYEITYRIRDAESRVRWVWERGRPVTHPGQLQPHLEGFITDVTEARETAETRDRLSAVLEASPDFVCMTDPDRRTFYLNPTGRRLLEYDEQADLSTLTVEDFLPARLRAWTVEEILPLARKHGVWQGEHILRAKDGAEIPVSGVIVAHTGSSGQVTFYSVVFRDIRHLKEAQERLARERDFIHAMVENMPGLFGVATPEGGLVRWNRNLERLTGRPPEVLASSGAVDLFPDDQRARLQDTLRETLEQGEGKVELDLLSAAGERVPFDLECHLVTIAGERYLVGFGYDLSKRKEAEELARRHLSELAHASRLSTAGEMATQLAHELNQPLAAISASSKACLNFFERPEPDYRKVRGILEEMQKQSQRAGKIINQLRSLVSRDHSRWEQLDLNALLDNVLYIVEGETTAKGAELRSVLSAELAPIYGDATLVEQVVLNLIRNAADAVAEHGTVEGRGRIRVTTDALDAECALVSVEDNGPGLSEAQLEQVFEPYFTSKRHGMGLGLRISQSIVEAHGGRLWAEPNAGPGVTFRFTLPFSGVWQAGPDPLPE